MKKYLIIFILLFLTCGCSINYELEINDDVYKETILIGGERSKLGLNNNNKFLEEREQIYKNLWTKYNILNSSVNSESYYYKIKADFSNQTDFLNDSMLNILFNKNMISTNANGNKIYEFSYVQPNEDEEGAINEDYESIKVYITSNKKIVNANNDEISNNRYAWIIKPHESKSIYFEIQNENALEDTDLTLILVVILGVIFIISAIVFNKSKKAQKI